ncbi:hypothetical protein [Caballeronia sp. RCC_10]|uniref:hypothetical protein n=1 Tax=Caballeronia sp. RCC_10 TaxID=3239227 RepID=UPI003524405F
MTLALKTPFRSSSRDTAPSWKYAFPRAEELIGEYVTTLSDDVIRELLLEAVERDAVLRDKLLFAARTASAALSTCRH